MTNNFCHFFTDSLYDDKCDTTNGYTNTDSEVYIDLMDEEMLWLCMYMWFFPSTQDPVNEHETEAILSSHEKFNFVSVLTK